MTNISTAKSLTLGIDVGTTSVKAGLLDESGVLLSMFSERYPTTRGEGRVVEQNPEDWVQMIDKALAKFANEGHAKNINAVGLCSQVNTHVFVDAQGQALLPAILWQDGRATAEAAELDALVSDEKKCEWWGAPMPIDASNVLSRMLWVARHKPDVWNKTRWVMLPKDYCLFRLTGNATTDPLSNIGLVDQQLNYIAEVFDLVPGSVGKLAPLAPVTEQVGTLRGASSLADLPVVSGTMDAWAGLVGAGGAQTGSSVYLSGTSEILGISSNVVHPTPGVIVFAENDGIRMHAAPTQSGGDAKVWFAELNNLSFQKMSQLVANTSCSQSTPLFLPQLEGERAPLWDTTLRASFIGMSRRTQLGDMARAVYEGVAFSARHALETLQASSGVSSDYINCGGGGFRCNAWNQIRADVLGVELRTLASNEPGVLGAAAFAAIGVGVFETVEQANTALAVKDRTYHPSEAAHQRYTDLFEIYKDAIAVNAAITKKMAPIT